MKRYILPTLMAVLLISCTGTINDPEVPQTTQTNTSLNINEQPVLSVTQSVTDDSKLQKIINDNYKLMIVFWKDLYDLRKASFVKVTAKFVSILSSAIKIGNAYNDMAISRDRDAEKAIEAGRAEGKAQALRYKSNPTAKYYEAKNQVLEYWKNRGGYYWTSYQFGVAKGWEEEMKKK